MKEHDAEPQRNMTQLRTPPDQWAATLKLVERFAEALQASEQRIQELEDRGDEILRGARAQLKAAHAQVEAAEARTLKAEQLENDAHERHQHSREWLMRIHEELEQLPIAKTAPRGQEGKASE